MKVHVLFNDAGEVGAIFHPKAGKDRKRSIDIAWGWLLALLPAAKANRRGKVTAAWEVGFLPQEGQNSGILDVPAELEDLTPRALHESVRVVTIGGAHRLVCKA
jgi:hypothetical protein